MLKQFTNYLGQKQDINFDLAFGANDGSSQYANNKWVVAHSTATPNAPAKNIATYFKREWSRVQSYTHFSIDDTSCYASGEQGYVAWGAGPTANQNSQVQIELCEFTDRTRAMNAYKNFVNFLRDACADLGLPISSVVTHKWLSNTYHESDHTDPVTYLATLGISEDQFRKDLSTGFTASPNESQPVKPADNPNKGKVEITKEVGIYDKADLSSQCGVAKVGEVYDFKEELAGQTYRWVKLTNNKFIPIAVKEKVYGIIK